MLPSRDPRILILISAGIVAFIKVPAIAGQARQDYGGGSTAISCVNIINTAKTTASYVVRPKPGLVIAYGDIGTNFDEVDQRHDYKVFPFFGRISGGATRNSLSTEAKQDGTVVGIVYVDGVPMVGTYVIPPLFVNCDPPPTNAGNPNPPSPPGPPDPNNPPNPPPTCGNPPLPYCAYLDDLSGVKAADALEEEILKHRNSISQINKIAEAAINSPSSLIVKNEAGQVAKVSSLTLDPSTQLFIKGKEAHLD